MKEAHPEDWAAAVELIQNATHILLICHVSPDGDAIGSLLGLGLGLRTLGKKTVLACESSPPSKFSFLSGYNTIVNEKGSTPFNLIIGLDSSDPSRLGNIYNVESPTAGTIASDNGLSGTPLINIDHHVTNLYYGDVNVVNPQAASTAEMILVLLDQLGVPLDHDGGSIATCLLTGIVTDTLGFRTSNVTPQVMGAAMRLMTAGASLAEVTHYAFNQRPLTELSLLALGLSHMQTEGPLAWSEITLADRHTCGHRGNGDAGLVGMLVRTKEIHIAAVFTETDNHHVEISFRADPGYDVAQLALNLGGGGHPAAAGCTVDGPIEAAKARVLPMLRAALEEKSNQP